VRGRQTYFDTVTIPRSAITISNNEPKDKWDATASWVVLISPQSVGSGEKLLRRVRHQRDAASVSASQEEWHMRRSDKLGCKDWQTILHVTEIFVFIFDFLFHNFYFLMYAKVKGVLNPLREATKRKQWKQLSKLYDLHFSISVIKEYISL
jgi:hypothetical protein